MLARLIIALLLVVFAVPAAAPAACHDTPAMTQGMAAHEMTSGTMKHSAITPHGCVGCIPPSDWAGATVAASFARPPVAPLAAISALVAGTAPTLVLPPPRLG